VLEPSISISPESSTGPPVPVTVLVIVRSTVTVAVAPAPPTVCVIVRSKVIVAVLAGPATAPPKTSPPTNPTINAATSPTANVVDTAFFMAVGGQAAHDIYIEALEFIEDKSLYTSTYPPK
jgi:hypothetical protein